MSGYKGFSVSGGVEEVYVNHQKAFSITFINQYEIHYAIKNLLSTIRTVNMKKLIADGKVCDE